jgi:Tol biopolymer transport system component
MRRVIEGVGLAMVLSGAASAQLTQRISTGTSGVQDNGGSWHPAISADGRIVTFDSWGSSLVPGDTNAVADVIVRDRISGQTTRASVSSTGVQGDGGSYYPAISADSRFVAYQSDATNLVPGDTNAKTDIFVRDLQAGTTERVSVASNGAQANGVSGHASISGDGRYVTFYSYASNLVAGDTNGVPDVFVHDRATGATTRVSVSTSGVQADDFSTEPAISPDGRFVVFGSAASNLVAGDYNIYEGIYLHDRASGVTERISVPVPGGYGNGLCGLPCLSDDGRYVAFESVASDLVPNDTNGREDIFVRDRVQAKTTRISVNTFGEQGNGDSHWPSMSADGRYVSYFGWSTNLVPGDINGVWDVFLLDRESNMTTLVSLDSYGQQGNADSGGGSFSHDARFLAFSSWATNLIASDTNATTDVFVRDFAPTGFASSCDPGAGAVIACPCANAPSGPGRGCNNSAATGGASLGATGTAYLSLDRLIFTTQNETASATSIVMQGNAEIAGGLVFGQGVRCVGGTLKRLYVKTATAGSITAPDPVAGDAPVSARSAALGQTIAPGQSLYYLVYYRDSIVLGGCPSTSTFNATQTGRIAWWP